MQEDINELISKVDTSRRKWMPNSNPRRRRTGRARQSHGSPADGIGECYRELSLRICVSVCCPSFVVLSRVCFRCIERNAGLVLACDVFLAGCRRTSGYIRCVWRLELVRVRVRVPGARARASALPSRVGPFAFWGELASCEPCQPVMPRTPGPGLEGSDVRCAISG